MQTLTIDYDIDSSRDLVVKLPASVAPGRHRIEIVIDPQRPKESAPAAEGGVETPDRAARWRELLALREQAIAEGMPLLDWDGIDAEVRERRGGLADES
jgi:hypothetical protein